MASELAVLRYTDDLGRTLTIPLTVSQIQEWFECFENHKPFIVHLSDQIRGVNPSKIIDWTIAGVSPDLKSMRRTSVADITWESGKPIVKQERVLPSTSKENIPESSVLNETPPLKTGPTITEETTDTSNGKIFHKKETLFKVECKCGEEYTLYNFRRSTRSGCVHCNQIVVVDYSPGLIETDQGEAWLMTNKYWVRKQTHPDDEVKETLPSTDFKTDVMKNELTKWSAKNQK
ncbi:hypothetical protein OM416_19805 [Paenibacillus sp. LS1]|uniref:hypothetical protein n=1 Tax=Paenibacillus sp. LS1 TaxID=2992120 RepID=UPI00222F29B2|nr:hypothetical protein [Paenibacillus sp. LS1]MCW3793841.1 hypothetical protein [Paenibacillus sp. LS1]